MREWRVVPSGEPSDRASYELKRCDACGTAATSEPAPEDAYETGAYTPVPPRLARPVRGLKRWAQRLVTRILRRGGVRPAARILDAGAGAGALVDLLRRAGYDAYGIEPRRREAGAAPVLAEAVEEHRASDVDAVVMWHVLEHLDDPRAAVAKAAEWLRPGGHLLVGVPNIASLQAALAGGEWFHLDVPRHRTHFSARGLRTLLDRSGFVVVRERHLVAEHNPLGMWFALLTRIGMTPGFPFHLLKRNAPVTARDVGILLVAGPLLLLPALVVELVAAAVRRGGTVAVLARRQDA
jgi:SAM-dependent methyltransferase